MQRKPLPGTMFVRSNMIKCFLLALVFFIMYEIIVLFTTKPKASEEGPFYSESDSLIPKIPIKVSVYYESLCPDSKYFVMHQLVPAYDKASRLIDYELVPYGKAKTEEQVPPGNRYKFDCQHGAVECHANKIHACATKYITDKTTLLKFVSCMIDDNSEPEQVASDCSKQFNVEVKPLLNCANEAEGEVLLKNYGEKTAALRPAMTFVPTVTLNDNQYNQAHILKDLLKTVCELFPKESQPTECGR